MEPPGQTFGERLKMQRKALQMTQEEAAAEFEVSRAAWQYWETNAHEPHPDQGAKLAAFFARKAPPKRERPRRGDTARGARSELDELRARARTFADVEIPDDAELEVETTPDGARLTRVMVSASRVYEERRRPDGTIASQRLVAPERSTAIHPVDSGALPGGNATKGYQPGTLRREPQEKVESLNLTHAPSSNQLSDVSAVAQRTREAKVEGGRVAVTAQLSEPLVDALDRVAERRNWSRSRVMREAVARGVLVLDKDR